MLAQENEVGINSLKHFSAIKGRDLVRKDVAELK